MAKALGPLAHGLSTIRGALVGYGGARGNNPSRCSKSRLPMGTVPPKEETETKEPKTSVGCRYFGSFSNEPVVGSIDIGRLVKDFLPAPGQSGSRSTAT
jgi:hypothetical protein